MTKHEALGDVVAALKGAGLPFYRKATSRKASVPGVHVALSARRGIDVFANGDTISIADVRAALGARWTEIYTNEAGKCVTVIRRLP